MVVFGSLSLELHSSLLGLKNCFMALVGSLLQQFDVGLQFYDFELVIFILFFQFFKLVQ